MASWRQACINDVPGLLQVADVVHPDLPESAEVFTERIQLFPEGCLVLAEGDQIHGYAISHPIRKDQPPALDRLLGGLEPEPDAYYIHDLAILPTYRGRGLAADCVSRLLKTGERYESICLIAVYGTAGFWGRYGFVEAPMDEPLKEKVRGYGDDAVFLSRQRAEYVDSAPPDHHWPSITVKLTQQEQGLGMRLEESLVICLEIWL